MRNTIKWILVLCDVIVAGMFGISVAITLLFEPTWDTLNKYFIVTIIFSIVLLLFFNLIWVASFNLKKFDNQEHLRLVESRWNSASFKLNKVLQKLETDIRHEIIEEVIKNKQNETNKTMV